MTPLDRKSWRVLALLVLLLLGVIILMSMLRGCSSSEIISSDGGTGKSGGDTIDVAIDYSPMSLYTYGDTLGGLSHDIMVQVARIAGFPVKFHPVTSLDRALRDLNDGLVDVVVADLPVTTDFQRMYRFTEPVYLDRQGLLQHRDTSSLGAVDAEPVKSVLDLAGRRVWVVANSPAETRLHNLSAEIGDTIYIEHDEQYGAELLALLTSIGEIQLCVVNEQVAKAMAKDSPTLDVMTNVSFTQFQAWAMRRDAAELAEKIDTAIVRFKATSDYETLLSRYLK